MDKDKARSFQNENADIQVSPGQQHDVLFASSLQHLNSGTPQLHGHPPAEQWWAWDLTYHRALYSLSLDSTLPSLEITLEKSHLLKRLRHEVVETV